MGSLLALVALAACSDPALTGASGELVVSPARLDFPPTHLGERATLVLGLDNRGRSTTSFELVLAPPFSVTAAAGELAGGEQRSLQIFFAPEALGDASGSLLVRSEAGGSELALAGTGLPRVDCPTPPECAWVRFDEELGACVEEPLPDGSVCGGACVRNGACLAGVCVGTAASCDDGDPCNADACDPLEGCLHFDATCPSSDDLCTVSRCDPALGCVADPVEDGTRCGPPSDCSTEHRCRSGVCVEVQSTELAPCGEITPCRAAGVCRHGACDQPPARPLVPAFRLPVGAGRTLLFDGVTDPTGNLFWAECTDRSCVAASATGGGFSRWRSELFHSDGSRPPAGHLALAGDRLVSTLAPDEVEALDAGDGTALWRAHLPALLAPELPAGLAFELEEVGAPVLQPDGAVALLVHAVPADDLLAEPLGFVLVLDGGTGALRVRLREEGELSGLLGDERGNLYYTVLGPIDDGGERARLVSLRPDGGARWRVRSPFQPPLGSMSGALLQGTGELRSTTNGRVRTTLELAIPLWPAAPLLDGSDAWLIGFPSSCESAVCRSWVPRFVRIPIDDGVPAFAVPLPSSEPWERSEPLLTSAGSALLVTATPGSRCAERTLLRELGPDGAPAFTCELPPGGSWSGAVSLTQGRFVIADGCAAALVGFDLPDLDTALRGWVTSGGEPGRSGRPR